MKLLLTLITITFIINFTITTYLADEHVLVVSGWLEDPRGSIHNVRCSHVDFNISVAFFRRSTAISGSNSDNIGLVAGITGQVQ